MYKKFFRHLCSSQEILNFEDDSYANIDGFPNDSINPMPGKVQIYEMYAWMIKQIVYFRISKYRYIFCTNFYDC